MDGFSTDFVSAAVQRIGVAFVGTLFSAYFPTSVDRARCKLKSSVDYTHPVQSNPAPRWYWNHRAWSLVGAMSLSALMALTVYVACTDDRIQDLRYSTYLVVVTIIFLAFYWVINAGFVAYVSTNRHAKQRERAAFIVFQGLPTALLVTFLLVCTTAD
jgi:hypothetical protein